MSSKDKPIKVGVLISPGVALMDLFGAHAVFGLVPDVEFHILWKNQDLIEGSPRFPIAATTTFDECPPLDVLILGAVPPDIYNDIDVISFISRQAQYDPYWIGICGGVLLLGAAGLLEGKRATTNFHLLDYLCQFGAIAISGGEVQVDGKLFTAGPATGGFEAALLVLEQVRGVEQAKLVELTIEYHPIPPFNVGTPKLAGPAQTAVAKDIYYTYFNSCAEKALRFYESKT
ncbi:DJ-1/PfpI family protein [Pseudomonas sp. CFSAN084952]|uniref:DJ-1/PfpI family protein n=1 Tax=Pseudomonas TaxID=286 RepID=UPI001299AC11|nr:DJ-1/PfpI family protein [Pseudomonas sp. CFSAN084952]QGF93006.1 DJ-1/PfpI family protein [Pseudomonas sp. CFSAN084952]